MGCDGYQDHNDVKIKYIRTKQLMINPNNYMEIETTLFERSTKYF